jgi:hypothetical protein
MVVIKPTKEFLDEKEKREWLQGAVEEFVEKNDKELRKFYVHKTGIYDRDMVHDAIGEFYLNLMESDALFSFGKTEDDAVYGKRDEKGGYTIVRGIPEDKCLASFNTYITNRLCWLLPVLARKNFRHKRAHLPKGCQKECYQNSTPNEEDSASRASVDYTLMSTVTVCDNKLWAEEKDVFELVGKRHAVLKISNACDSSLLDEGEDPTVTGYIDDFKAYIRRTERPAMAEKMIVYLDNKLEGCKGVMIAGMLKSSKKKAAGKPGVSNNLVKIVRQSLQRKYVKWQGIIAA